MKQIRLILGLLGVLLFVFQTHAAALESPLDILKPEKFDKLTFDQKIIVVIQLRHALIEAERDNGGEANFATNEILRRSPLWDLGFPTAEAGQYVPGDWCLRNGRFSLKTGGNCPDIPQGSCTGNDRQCEETFFGPGLCAKDTSGCEAAMKLKPFSDDKLREYLRDPAHMKVLDKNRDVFHDICGNSHTPSCNEVSALMASTSQILKQDLVPVKPVTFKVAPVPALNAKDPALRPTGAPVADAPQAQAPPPPPPAAPPVTAAPPNAPPNAPNPNQYTADEQAARDDIQSESGDVGKCNQWELAAEVFPDSHLPIPSQLMSFEQAQQMMCEHKPFTSDEAGAIGKNMVAKLDMVAHKNKTGQYVCNTTVKSSTVGSNCARIFALMKNLTVCQAESNKHAPDTNWAHAIATKPGVTVDEPNGGDGTPPVTVNFLAGYKHLDEIKLMYSSNPAKQFKGTYADAGIHPVINGKYLSSMLAIWKVPICDVRRNESRGTGVPPTGGVPNQPAAPNMPNGHHHHDGQGPGPGYNHLRNGAPSSGSVGATDGDVSREPASTVEESSDSSSGWVVPTLPQGAPGAGGRPTSGQGTH